jgi:glycosyltransferase involved in cell wall biosynthesis
MDLVSIVITVLNGQDKIKRCLESVTNQTYTNLEFVIFDDGSTDATRQIILSFISVHKGIKFKFDYANQNIGRSTALNKCLENTTGKYLAIMDADDEMYPDRIAQQVNYLNRNPTVSVVGGAQLMDLADGTKKINWPPQTDNLIKAGLFVRTTMLHPTVMIRREFLINNGIKYNPDYHLCEDYKIFVDLLYAGAKFANLPEVVNTYDYSTAKSWDKHDDRMVSALRKIWAENFRRISIVITENDINFLLKSTGKLDVGSVKDILFIAVLFLKCCIFSNSHFGNKLLFTYVRVNDLRFILKTFFRRKLHLV